MSNNNSNAIFINDMNLFGIHIKQIPCIVGEGSPTSDTYGAVGMLYMDSSSSEGEMWKCIKVEDNKYTWVKLINEDSGVNPDWNQNDETASDYIKGRTHYEEAVMDVLTEAVVEEYGTLPEATYEVGKVYTIKIGSVSYEMKCVVAYVSAFGHYRIGFNIENGNQSVLMADRELPMLVSYASSDSESIKNFTTSMEVRNNWDGTIVFPATVRISSIVKHIEQLHPKFVGTDWNVNDPDAPGYIANRTHYVGPIDYVTWDGESLKWTGLNMNHTYTVQIGEDVYEEVPLIGWGTSTNDPRIYLGDRSLKTYPFSLMIYPGRANKDGEISGSEYFGCTFDTSVYPNATGADVRVYREGVHKIDPKFLPTTFMVVNFAYDEENNTFTADKTFDEVYAAIEAGQYVMALDPDGLPLRLAFTIPGNIIVFECNDTIYMEGILNRIVFVLSPEGAQFAEDGIGFFRPATEEEDGAPGFVPPPMVGDQNKFLRGDGSWSNPQSDWNVSNPEKIGYIANRTHYEVPEIRSNLELVDSDNSVSTYMVGPYQWEIDKAYRICVDGVEYTFDSMIEGAVMNALGGKTAYYLGAEFVALHTNISWDTYPFSFVTADFSEYIYAVFEDGTANHTVEIIETEGSVKQLHPKFVGTDWNVNDPESPGYIANRTHYVDRIDYVAWDGESLKWTGLNMNYTYTVQIGEDVYEEVPLVRWGTTNDPRIDLGDHNLKKYPFGLVIYPGHKNEAGEISGGEYFGCTFDTSVYPNATGADVQVYREEIHKIDPKFLPNTSMVVNFSYDEENDTYTANKTFDEVVEAIITGRYVAAFDPDGMPLRLWTPTPEGILFERITPIPYMEGSLAHDVFALSQDGAMYIEDRISIFAPATEEADGLPGFVPPPMAGDQNKFLRGDGSWSDEFILHSSTEGSSKRFRITVDDSGALTATEVAE